MLPRRNQDTKTEKKGQSYHGTYAILGPPGTGKTTRIAQSVARICRQYPDTHEDYDGLPAMVCSLTRTAAFEAAGRISTLPESAVGTLHSQAFHALGCPQLTEGHLKEWNSAQPDLALTRAIDPDDPLADSGGPGASRGDLAYLEYSRCRARCEPITGNTWLLRFATTWEAWKADTGLLDFSDLVQHAAESTYSAPGQPSVILADEAQDLSRLELKLLYRWAESADALILVGDPWQALYEWRGACPELLQAADIPPDHRDTLGQSYRVPRAVHRAAYNVATYLSDYQPIDYRPRDYDGTVEQIESASYKAPTDLVDYAEQVTLSGGTCMVMAPCGYMLVPTIMELRSRGLPYANPWRRTNGRWNPLGRGWGVSATDRFRALLVPITGQGWKDTPQEDGTEFNFGANVATTPRRTWTVAEVAAFTEPLVAGKCLNRGGKKALETLAKERPDMHAHPRHVIEEHFRSEVAGWLNGLADRSMEDAVKWYLSHCLEPRRAVLKYPAEVLKKRGLSALVQKPRIYVGTIHSFKGAEADHVLICPDLSLKGWQEWQAKRRDPIIRMAYVALTRAREHVRIVQPAGSAIPLWGMCNDSK